MIIDLTHTITPDMPMYPGSEAPIRAVAEFRDFSEKEMVEP